MSTVTWVILLTIAQILCPKEPVQVEGELVPVDEVDLAPGETLFAGDLVLVVSHIQPIS